MNPNKYLKHIAFDNVIFGYSNQKLQVLVMEYHNTGLFALPGGFIAKDENLHDAAKRGLKERTGLDQIYLEQFHTFGSVARHQAEVMQTIINSNPWIDGDASWLLERFISVAHYALINIQEVTPTPDALSDSCGWYDVRALPTLILDHSEIIEKALKTLQQNLNKKLVGANLLPEKFTMKELQGVYEAIFNEKLHRGTFQRKMLSYGQLERFEKQFSGGAHKAPFVYSFKSDTEV